MSASTCEQIASLRRKLQRCRTTHVLFLDETALRLNAAPNHTLTLPQQQPFVETTDTSSYAARYDMIAVCSGEGVLLPKVFTPDERKGAKVKGIHNDMLLQFIDDTLAQAVEGLNQYPMTLVLDRASIHLNKAAILQAFRDRSSGCIKDILLMPPHAAKRMSPLDNALFHDWKEKCRQKCPVTKKTIQRVMADAWNALPKKLVQSHFQNCGLTSSTDPYFDCPAPDIHRHGR